MPAPQSSASSHPILRRVLRFALTVAVMLTVGRLAGAAMRADSKLEAPAGLFRGVLHGAMMPLAFPTLLIGHDSPIYAEHNSGRLYKLGYTIGVNLCGAAFFSFMFHSVRRWKDRPRNSPSADVSAQLMPDGRQ